MGISLNRTGLNFEATAAGADSARVGQSRRSDRKKFSTDIQKEVRAWGGL